MSQRISPLLTCLLLLGFTAEVIPQEKSPLDLRQDRRYAQGPLSPKDYRAKPPEPADRRGRRAGITTDIRYDFHFQVAKRKDKLSGYIDTLAVFAVVLRDESWNTSPQDKALLDHEQGLFDLAQIEALRAQVDLVRRFDFEPLEATGKTQEEIHQTLDRELRKLIRPYVNAANETKAEYDRVTRIGTLPDEEAQAREQHREELKKLVAAAAKNRPPVP